MYGVHVESENGNQNSRWWQVILPFEFKIISCIVNWVGVSQNQNNGKEYLMQLFTQNPG
jgi:hypothetical protein